MRGRAGAVRVGAVSERAPAVAIPRASHDISDALHISRVTYVNIKCALAIFFYLAGDISVGGGLNRLKQLLPIPIKMR